MRPSALICAVLALVALAAPAHAHTMSNGYLELTVEGASARGQLDLSVRDLNDAVGLDVDLDGAVRWSEARARTLALTDYVASALVVANGADRCGLTFGALGTVRRADGEHLALPITASCDERIGELSVDYRLLFEIDAQHRGLVQVARAGAAEAAQLRLVDRPGPVTFALVEPSADVLGFVWQGVWHIWIGLDHILFLIALLLPAVFRRRGRTWEPAPSFGEVARDVFDVVTAFTLAHSITLVLSTLGHITLPVRLIETAIAMSVAAAALGNLVRVFDARWAVAFALGLLHGFGFSNVLIDLGLPRHHLVSALLGFNLGVELGQLAIVAAFLPAAYAARRTSGYRVLLWAGSVAMAIVAVQWSIERALS